MFGRLDILRHRLMHPDLVEEFISAFLKETNAVAQEREAGYNAKHKEHADVVRRLDGLIDAITDDQRSPGLNHKLESKLARPPLDVPRFHPNFAHVYK